LLNQVRQKLGQPLVADPKETLREYQAEQQFMVGTVIPQIKQIEQFDFETLSWRK
jgi:hypothetical protein